MGCPTGRDCRGEKREDVGPDPEGTESDSERREVPIGIAREAPRLVEGGRAPSSVPLSASDPEPDEDEAEKTST